MQFLIEILRQFVSNWIKLIFLLGLASNLYGQSQQNIIAVYANKYYFLDTIEKIFLQNNIPNHHCGTLRWNEKDTFLKTLAANYVDKQKRAKNTNFPTNLPKYYTAYSKLFVNNPPPLEIHTGYSQLVILDNFTYWYTETENSEFIFCGRWKYLPATTYIRLSPPTQQQSPENIDYFLPNKSFFIPKKAELLNEEFPFWASFAYNLDSLTPKKSNIPIFKVLGFDLNTQSDMILCNLPILNLTRRLYKPFKTPKNAPKRIRIRRQPPISSE